MLSFQDSLQQLALLNFNHNTYGETLAEITEHLYCQIEDQCICWIEENNKIVAYGDWLWINDEEDIRLFEEIGMIPNGRVGGKLYVNNVVLDSEDKSLIWSLWKMRPNYESICWKRENGRIKTWRVPHAKIS